MKNEYFLNSALKNSVECDIVYNNDMDERMLPKAASFRL